MSIDIEQFHSVFFDESDEHLDDMEQLLMSLDVDSPDPEELNSIFRAAHSIKGGSGIFGFDALMNLTHVMENLLDKARNNELNITADIVNVLLETLDVLKDTLNAYREETPVPEDAIAARINVLNSVISGRSAERVADSSADSLDTNEEKQSESGSDDSFGFFDDEPADVVLESDDGFGFFDDDPAPSNSQGDEGFGFFDDESAQVSTQSEDGFGFFDDGEETLEPKSASEEQGFGFFDDAPSAAQINTDIPSASSTKSEDTSSTAPSVPTPNSESSVSPRSDKSSQRN